MRSAPRISAFLAVLALLASACGDGAATTTDPPTAPAAQAPVTAATTAPPPTPTATSASPDATVVPTVSGDFDPTLTREDVDCDQEALEGDGDEYLDAYVAAHYVVDGTLGARCFGDEDVTLLDAWELLSTITPPSELGALAILAGFDTGEAADDEEAVTLAFVNVIGDQDGTAFQLSLNLPASDESANEFRLTVAHEFSHIIAGESSQLDRFAEPGDCDTYDNGEGCFLPGAYLDDWVAEFWTEDELAQLDPESDDPEGAEDRCNLNPDFLGAYAATDPDEDFSESFAAFVFEVEVDTPGLEDKMSFFAERPDLAEFRDRAGAAGLAGLPNEFDLCG